MNTDPPFLLHRISSPSGRILSLGLEILPKYIDEEGIRICEQSLCLISKFHQESCFSIIANNNPKLAGFLNPKPTKVTVYITVDRPMVQHYALPLRDHAQRSMSKKEGNV